MADLVQLPCCIIGQDMPQHPWPCLAPLAACAQAILPEAQHASLPLAAQQVAPFLPHCMTPLAFCWQQRSPGFAPFAIMGHCIGCASFCAIFTQHGHAALLCAGCACSPCAWGAGLFSSGTGDGAVCAHMRVESRRKIAIFFIITCRSENLSLSRQCLDIGDTRHGQA